MLMYIYFIIFPHFLFEDSLVSASLCSKIVLIIYSNVKTFGDSNKMFLFILSFILSFFLSFVQQG